MSRDTWNHPTTTKQGDERPREGSEGIEEKPFLIKNWFSISGHTQISKWKQILISPDVKKKKS